MDIFVILDLCKNVKLKKNLENYTSITIYCMQDGNKDIFSKYIRCIWWNS